MIGIRANSRLATDEISATKTASRRSSTTDRGNGVKTRDHQLPHCFERLARLLICIAACCVICLPVLVRAADAAATNAPLANFVVQEVAGGVFVHSGKPLALDDPDHDDIANIGFIVGTKCVAVVDTGGSVRVGRALRAAIRQRSQLPICYVINTHVHVDHVLGNFAFKAEHASFVGHALLPSAIARSSGFFLQHYAADFDQPPSAAQIIAPDRKVDGQLDLDLGDRVLQLRAWPKAHTDCDLTVLDAKTGTLWTGDLLFRERLPALDGSSKGWLAVIDELKPMTVKTVIPGHGAVTRNLADALIPERRYLHAVMDGVRAEIAAGESIEHAMGQVALSEKSHWLLWDSTHAHNVSRVYQELEWE
jgi:quinoprotein relay system zinc metallohydrolase 2